MGLFNCDICTEGYKQQQHGALSVLKQIFDYLFDIIKYITFVMLRKISEAPVMRIHNH